MGLLDRPQRERVSQLLLFRGRCGVIPGLAKRQHRCLDEPVCDRPVQRIGVDVIACVHRGGEPDRRCWIQLLQRCVECHRAQPVQVGLVGNHHQIVQALEVVEQHARVLIEAPRLTTLRFCPCSVGLAVLRLRGN